MAAANYYANAKGEITRGFKTIDGKTYFSMITAPCIPDGCTIMVKYYYLNPSDGVMVTGTKISAAPPIHSSDSGISSRALEGNWTVKVNRQQNVVTVYKGNTPVRAMICSTGLNNGTPLGTFTIQDKLYTHALYGPSFGYYCFSHHK